MRRKDFIKKLSGCGICSCAGIPLIFSNEAEDEDKGFSATKDCEWKKNFTQKRFNWLLQILEEELEDTEYRDIIRLLGKRCAQSIEFLAKENRGDPEGYFRRVNEMWGEVFEYDRQNQVIHLNTNLKECPCPNVNTDTPGSYCECSLGWQKFMFETVFEKPVEVRHKETILRGGNTCRFEISIKA
ncbi:MAG: hypothetical protein PVF73_00215 [Bacteroidales bacterium]|jgi:hypothetical protein